MRSKDAHKQLARTSLKGGCYFQQDGRYFPRHRHFEELAQRLPILYLLSGFVLNTDVIRLHSLSHDQVTSYKISVAGSTTKMQNSAMTSNSHRSKFAFHFLSESYCVTIILNDSIWMNNLNYPFLFR